MKSGIHGAYSRKVYHEEVEEGKEKRGFSLKNFFDFFVVEYSDFIF
ncbi:MAG: hypothetical protein LBC31_08530 [Treponema sp.]|jgi:hypothetical protein|nr:hypothetical protein [Treponema sp.]